MKIKPPISLGKLRYVQYADVKSALRRQRAALWWYLLVLFFCAAISGLLVWGCIMHTRAWSDYLLAALMTFGTVVGLQAYLPMLNRIQVGMVCDRGVGYGWFREDGSLARQEWYAFAAHTTLSEWRGRDGRTWNMQDRYTLAFCEGGKKCFVASYLVRYEDDSNLEFMRRAVRAFQVWRYRLGQEKRAVSGA